MPLARHYGSLSIALDAALARDGASIDLCVMDAAVVLSQTASARVERHGNITTVRSNDAGRRIVLRARVIDEAPDATVPVVSGERVSPVVFAQWLEGLTLDGVALARGDGAVLGADSAEIRLPPGTVADAGGIRSALTAAFGIPALADIAADRPVPVQIDQVWRRGPLPVERAIARLVDAVEGGPRIDCLLVDADEQPILVLRGIAFAASHLLLDPDEILAKGQGEAENRLLRELIARAAVILGADAAHVAADQPMIELGFDSLSAAQLHAHVVKALGVEIPFERLARATSLRDLACVGAAELARRHAPDDDGFGVARFLNPAMARRLRAGRLDRAYVRGSGSILVDSEGREVIDFVAQFGALPFGHNPVEVWDALDAVRRSQSPIMAGLSLPVAAARLAERLVSLAPSGLDRAFFCSSGAEAIEAVIKLCRAATGRSGVLSTLGAYHGLTLGALSATGRPAYQTPFAAPLPDFDKVPYGDIDGLREAIGRNPTRYAAFIVEPIQGEGGIVEPPAGYLAAAAKLCRSHGVAFVLDEVQTGLGRCGTLFASNGVAPDATTLAKALGGGLVPMGAVLYRSELATEAFMLRHGSTFANNALGCAAAMATLDRLTANGNHLMTQVAERGAAVKAQLEAIRQRHPTIVRDVRGQGYLLGVAFSAEPEDYEGSISSVLCRSESFSMLLTSYLLEQHGVRVAPTMAQTSVLRVEPALDIAPSLFTRLTDGVAALAEALDRGDSRAVFGHVLGIDPATRATFLDRRTRTKAKRPSTVAAEGRFAFLVHLMDLSDLERFDPSLVGLPRDALFDTRATVPDLLEPAALATIDLNSPDGRCAVGDLIVVPHTAQELLEMPQGRSRQIVGDAVALAARRGAQIVGLGGFTSVVTGGGRSIAGYAAVPLTTGNGLTALAAVRGIEAALVAAHPADATTAAMIFGAFGSIGSATTKLLARRVGRLCLIVRNEDDGKIQERTDLLRRSLLAYLKEEPGVVAPGSVAAALLAGDDGPDTVVIAADPAPYWRSCNVVVTATSALRHLVAAADLAPGAIVCDVSRPINVPRDIARSRPDVVLIEGGVIRPYGPFDSGIDLGVGRDRIFACMAETMLLALEKEPMRGTIGQDIDTAKLPWLESAARRAAFTLSGWSGFDGAPFS